MRVEGHFGRVFNRVLGILVGLRVFTLVCVAVEAGGSSAVSRSGCGILEYFPGPIYFKKKKKKVYFGLAFFVGTGGWLAG